MITQTVKKLDPHALASIIDNFVRADRRKNTALLREYSVEDLKMAYATRPQYERKNGYLVLMKQKIDELDGPDEVLDADEAREGGSPFGIVEMQKRKPGRPKKL